MHPECDLDQFINLGKEIEFFQDDNEYDIDTFI